MSGNGELGRGLRRREKNATEAGARRFEKPALDARAAPPEAHELLIGRKIVAEVPLTGLSFEHAAAVARLPAVHTDPFDRMLIAQAKTEPLLLLTNDAILASYGDCVELAMPKPRRT